MTARHHTAPISVAIKLPVTGAPVVVTVNGGRITPTCVEWRTYIYAGKAWRLVTAYGPRFGNRTWPAEDAPDWIPLPPAAWASVEALVLAGAPEAVTS